LKMKANLNANHQLGEPLPQSIAIVRSLPGLGDLLCLVPALRALQVALPEAQISLIGLSWANSFVQRFSHYLNGWLEFPGWPSIPEVPLSPQRTVSFLAHVQQLNFDLALQMHGSGRYINSFTLLMGAKRSAGFFPSDHYCPDQNCFLPYPDQEPEVWRHLRLLEFLGVPLQGDHLEFPLRQSDWDEWEAIASVHALDHADYVCIHPGASISARRWSVQNFAAVADALAARGLQIVLTGTAAELALTQAVAETMRFPAINLAGQTSLGALAVLLKNSRLLVCNDTGVSHLAAALQAQSIVIFSNSDPQRWAPLDRQRHRVVGRDRAGCDMWGELGPTSAEALAEAADLLQGEFAYAS
jgi:ADP-heptose:LPS heptosyltransferase